MARDKKVSKAFVGYRVGTGHRCAGCAMFHPKSHSCDLVEGLIGADMVCDRWVAVKVKVGPRRA